MDSAKAACWATLYFIVAMGCNESGDATDSGGISNYGSGGQSIPDASIGQGGSGGQSIPDASIGQGGFGGGTTASGGLGGGDGAIDAGRFDGGSSVYDSGSGDETDANRDSASTAEAGEMEGSAPGDHPKFVGNITTNGQVRSDFVTYWDQITPENEGKWGTVEAERNNMNWSGLDAVYQYAKDNNIPFKQHTLVWGNQAPGWIDSLSQAEQAAEIEEWIRLFCERYPDTAMIDVVNEPDHKTPSFINAMGGAGTTGHDWIIWSFQQTKRYCPNSILILNDYNVLIWDTDSFVSIANKVKTAGLLDAVGAQAHGLESLSVSELESNLAKIATIGVPVYISEYDINLADDTEQKNVMEQQFSVFWNSPAVVGITLWGYVYGATWRTDTGLIRDGAPRPAFTWLLDYLGR